MTKAQLVAALANATGTDKSSVGAMLDALNGVITKTVAEGGAVTLPGVGKIHCRERPERMVRNPATGEQMKKEADKVVKVTIAKALKDSVMAKADQGQPRPCLEQTTHHSATWGSLIRTDDAEWGPLQNHAASSLLAFL